MQSVWQVAELRKLFQGESLQKRTAYVLLMLLALLYLLSQIGMAVLWIAGQAQVDSL
jgi:hypothetical protein